ncbi:putative catechol dioxygenase protein [Botrytis fragariae]|uniref:Putative catechol dioxygenase protein n=1 Tax=Botrytis fragariae TaxID=1964551 RepID=A0A8H6EKL3_9HELO|nr:putative catechol dioxygenase protein [Botrytis fragariae]KAF5875688.1 putative catechol dioxygenase protein [Botrytis fragariae]
MANATANSHGTASHKFDPNFTQNVIEAMGPKTSPRMREVMSCLIKHVHDFAREVELTVDEWMLGVELLNEAGKMSDHKRNEGQLVCDVIGLESLVDEITFKKAADAVDAPTASAILGPFFRHDAPVLENESSIIQTAVDDGEIVYMHGTVTDHKTKKPIVGATVDAWQASTNGLYEQQDDEQAEHNLRGKFKTDENGHYGFYCLKPTPYPVPFDGPAGKILQLLDRHPFRPAHIHLIVQHGNYKPLTTQIFNSNDEYLQNDSVFAVKDSLIVDFVPLKGNPKASLELNYPVVLAPQTGA